MVVEQLEPHRHAAARDEDAAGAVGGLDREIVAVLERDARLGFGTRQRQRRADEDFVLGGAIRDSGLRGRASQEEREKERQESLLHLHFPRIGLKFGLNGSLRKDGYQDGGGAI